MPIVRTIKKKEKKEADREKEEDAEREEEGATAPTGKIEIAGETEAH